VVDIGDVTWSIDRKCWVLDLDDVRPPTLLHEWIVAAGQRHTLAGIARISQQGVLRALVRRRLIALLVHHWLWRLFRHIERDLDVDSRVFGIPVVACRRPVRPDALGREHVLTTLIALAGGQTGAEDAAQKLQSGVVATGIRLHLGRIYCIWRATMILQH